jgi:hypothetical protein
MMDKCPYMKKHQSACPLSPHVHTRRKNQVSTQQQGSHLQTWKRTLTKNYQSQNLDVGVTASMGNKFRLFTPPQVYGISLWQPKLTNMPCSLLNETSLTLILEQKQYTKGNLQANNLSNIDTRFLSQIFAKNFARRKNVHTS